MTKSKLSFILFLPLLFSVLITWIVFNFTDLFTPELMGLTNFENVLMISMCFLGIYLVTFGVLFILAVIKK